jgi:hypothetical protein
MLAVVLSPTTSLTLVELPENDEDVPESAQVAFIRYLAEFAKIIRRIIKLVLHRFGFNSVPKLITSQSAESAESAEPSSLKLDQRESLRQEVEAWRASLPRYLAFPEVTEDAYNSYDPAFLYNWKARQQSSLRIR